MNYRFLAAGKKFNREKKRFDYFGVDHKLFVNEKLPVTTRRLLYDTKRFAQENGFKFCWVCNGLVNIKKSETSYPLVVRDQTVLDRLMTDSLSAIEDEL